MTTFESATTADFDRYAEVAFNRDLARWESDRHADLVREDEAEMAFMLDIDLPGWREGETESADPERFVSESDYFARA